jgi:hypothetical protein
MTEPMTDTAQPTRPNRGMTALWVTLGLLFAALVAVALYKAWPLLYPEVVATAPLDPACDLRAGPCTVLFPGGGEVRFAIEPRTLPPLAPLRIGVDLKGVEARSVEVDFAGTDMNMGYNRVHLTQTQVGRYEGQGMLPVCVRTRMGWEAKVLLHTPDGLWVAPFRFETISVGGSG